MDLSTFESDMKAKPQNVSIVLHKPHFPENIGSAARAAKNMGIDQLVVVRPVDCDLTRILKMATHAAEDVVAEMEVHDDLRDALAPYQYVVGTTARVGSHRQSVKSPEESLKSWCRLLRTIAWRCSLDLRTVASPILS